MRKQWNSKQRFSLRKFSTGLASVLLATMFMSQGVMAQTNEVNEKPNDTEEVVKPDNNNAVTTVQPKATENVVDGKVQAAGNVREEAEGSVVSTPGKNIGETLIKGAENTILNMEESNQKEKLTDNKPLSGNVIESQNNKELPEEESENNISKEKIDTKKLNDLISAVEKENKNNLPTTFKNEITEEINKAKLVLKDAKTQEEINKEITVLEGLKTRIEEANKPKRRGRRSERELTDVNIGLVKRGNISDDIIRVAPGGMNYVGSVLQVKAESRSDNIIDVTVDGAHGFMGHKVAGIGTKTVTVSFEGDTPGSGNYAITVTVKTAKGSKSFTFGHYTTLPKPTIETPDTDLTGKADKKPTVKIKANTTPPSSFVGGAKLRAYLIRNGADSTSYGGQSYGAYPEGYTILASKDVDASGNAEITESDYIVGKIGAGKVKAITVIELPNKVNDISVGERGSFISNERTVTAVAKVNKTDLETLVNGAAEKRKTHEYYNAAKTARDTYDNAIAAATTVLNKENVTQDEINVEKDKVDAALGGLTGAATNKNDLETLVNGAAEKRKTHEYYNAAKTARDTYDNAIAAATTVLNKENVTQDEINAEKDKVDAALGGLTGAATNKNDLETLVNGAAEKRKTHEYYNAAKTARDTYDNAIAAATTVLNKENVTQDEINAEKDKVDAALGGLTGAATNKNDLETLVNGAAEKRKTHEYYNAAKTARDTYDNAIAAATTVLNKENVTQDEINAEKDKVDAALGGLTGAATNKNDLETLVNGAAEKRKTHEYYNAAKTARDTYDNAIAAATTVLNKENVTQDEINAEKDKVDAALGGLTGAATNKNDLETLINGAAEKRKTHEYYNAAKTARDTYDNAIAAATTVLNKENVTQDEINAEKDKVDAALGGLTGAATNKNDLETLVNGAAEKRKTHEYYNAAKTARDTYDNAIAAATTVLNKENVTQDEINAEKDKVDAALGGLTGAATNKNDLETLINGAAEKRKTHEYYNAAKTARDTYDNAIAAATTVLNKENVTQDEINVEKDKVDAALGGLTGAATNKNDLETLVNGAAEKRKTHEYYNAAKTARDTYDNAIAAATTVLNKENVTQDEINAEKDKVDAALGGLTGAATNKNDLEALINGAAEKRKTHEYYNAAKTARDTYDNAIAAATTVLNKENVTQDEINAEKDKVDAALGGLTGAATNKNDLETLINGAAEKRKTHEYYNAAKTARDTYDNAIAAATTVLNKENVTQDEINAEKDKVDAALGGLTGAATNKNDLETLVNGAAEKRKTHEYYNAAKTARDTYDNAIAAATTVLNKENVTQDEINAEKDKVDAALGGLTGAATNKNDLETLVNGAAEKRKTHEYYNAAKTARDTYDNAIAAATTVLNKENVTQDEINAEKDKVDAALGGLTGAATNKNDLETLVNGAAEKRKTHEYYNAAKTARDTYDNAIAAATTVLNKENVTQDEINAEKDKVDAALGGLTGAATNKNDLETLINGAAEKRKTHEYYNAAKTARDTYDNAIAAATTVLNKENVTQDEINAEKDKVDAALGGLTGAATNKNDLETLVNGAAEKRKTHEYYNAAKTARDTYDNAIAAATTVLNKENVTQDEINAEKDKVDAALGGLTGAATNKNDLETLINGAAEKRKTHEYYNAAKTARDTYDNAIAAATTVLNKENVTQDEINVEKDKVDAALGGLTGAATNKNDLETLVNGAAEKRKTHEYYNAAKTARDTYDNAIAAATTVLNKENVTQDEINAEKDKVDAALGGLTGAATNKNDLETLVNGAAEKRKTHEYYNAAKTARDTYDNAIAAATTVLNKENVTQDEINAEKDKVDAALGGLTGAATNKNDLETLINGAAEKRKTHEYYNAAKTARDTYDNAIAAATTVLNKENVTQDEINAEKDKVDAALGGLTGAATNKNDLETLVNGAAEKRKTHEYYNAAKTARDTYDNAIAAATTVLNKENVTQDEINAEKDKVDAALGGLTGAATNKNDLETLINGAAEKRKTHEYYNAAKTARDTYDNAIAAATTVLNKENVTQDEINVEKDKVDAALGGLTGAATNKNDLETLVNGAAEKRKTHEYYNAAKTARDTYDNAIAAATTVLNKENVTQDEINAEKDKVDAALGGLTGAATNKNDLEALINGAAEKRKTHEYYNAAKTARDTYDNAIAAATTVLNKENVTQDEINAEKDKVDAALGGLTGAATNKNDLETLINGAAEKRKTHEYYNAAKTARDTYDNAIAAATTVLNKENVTQDEINAEKDKVDAALGGLTGAATNKNDLETLVNGAEAKRKTHEYYNADPSKQEAYDNAIAAAAEVLKKDNVTQSEINTEKNNVNTALQGLTGAETNKTALDAALSEEATTKASAAYYNATSDKKTAYDNAVELGKAIFNRTDATQTEVNDAVTAIANVKNALNGKETNHSQSDNNMMKALLAKKEEAKMLIEQEAMKKKAEISQAELSESEKALLDARVDQEKAKAFQMIDQVTTIEEVDQVLKAGIEVIRSIAVASANGRMTDVTPEESEAAMAQAHRQALPQTGTGNEVAIFGAAASAILAGLGLVVPSKKKED